ncbi:MAG TPA: glucose-6-phosphate isomerase, partial [Candidatus Wirthbacteria bacterium]|nr:glucose-6-phosphate isomerase [Candidatus Wirthbacteria bacterium]
MNKLHYDYQAALSEAIGPTSGITPDELQASLPLLMAAQEQMKTRYEKGDLRFLHLPDEREILPQIKEFREKNRWVKNFVVLGIGGSALGAIALHHTFGLLNQSTEQINFYCFDNVDPEELADFFENIDLATTLFNVVSKSGETLETAAGFLLARQILRQRLGDAYKQHLVFTTSETSGFLRQVAQAEQITMFAHPDDVGGRFTVLSIVGLLPA